MWKTYPQTLWIIYITAIDAANHVENLSTGNVDKMYRGDRYVDNVENLSTAFVDKFSMHQVIQ